jgi:hypothetical protein
VTRPPRVNLARGDLAIQPHMGPHAAYRDSKKKSYLVDGAQRSGNFHTALSDARLVRMTNLI